MSANSATLPKVAVLIDVANSKSMDPRDIKRLAEGFGAVQEFRAYGDFRQHHLGELAPTLYAQGFELIHCPSWRNGNGDQYGNGGWKRSDDVLLQKGAVELLMKRPSIDAFVFVTADADIIPTCHMLRGLGKKVVLIFDDDKHGHILGQCPFELVPVHSSDTTPDESGASDLSDGQRAA